MRNMWGRPRSSLKIGVCLVEASLDQLTSNWPVDVYVRVTIIVKRCWVWGVFTMQHYFGNNWWTHIARLNHTRKIFPGLQAMAVTVRFWNHKAEEIRPLSQYWDSCVTSGLQILPDSMDSGLYGILERVQITSQEGEKNSWWMCWCIPLVDGK